MSAESGIQTFRDGDGLWENYKIEEVATPEAFSSNPSLVIKFYNERRRKIKEAIPNLAHKILFDLEQHFDVEIITQNIDDLHERAGSTRVLHLHGEIFKMCSVKDKNKTYPILTDMENNMKANDGSLMRPFIVWFGEAVPMMEHAITICQQADILLIIGTSLQVYPAASLLHYAPKNIPVFLIDKNPPKIKIPNVEIWANTATEGMKQLREKLGL